MLDLTFCIVSDKIVRIYQLVNEVYKNILIETNRRHLIAESNVLVSFCIVKEVFR